MQRAATIPNRLEREMSRAELNHLVIDYAEQTAPIYFIRRLHSSPRLRTFSWKQHLPVQPDESRGVASHIVTGPRTGICPCKHSSLFYSFCNASTVVPTFRSTAPWHTCIHRYRHDRELFESCPGGIRRCRYGHSTRMRDKCKSLCNTLMNSKAHSYIVCVLGMGASIRRTVEALVNRK